MEDDIKDVVSNEDSTTELEQDTPNLLSVDELDSLNDEEFEEYMASGKLPDNFNNSNSNNKQEDDNVEEDTNENTDNLEESDESPISESKESDEQVKESNVDNNESSNKDSINYKEIYETIFKPFKANGKEITPRNVEDVISLMQMGANYTKKMQTYAPMRKTIESLNKAGINEEQLNFLIDIHKGDKEAIKKLLKNSEIDPIDLDLEQVNYKPNNNIASDADVAFSTALDDIKESVPKIKEITDNIWDKESTNALLKDPKLLIALHEEIQMGRFDKVQQMLELERTFGRYQGVSDLQAYIDIVNKLPDNSNSKQEIKQEIKQEVKQNIPDKTKAAPIRSNKPKSKSTFTQKDLLDMSDEEFNKLSIQDLI